MTALYEISNEAAPGVPSPWWEAYDPEHKYLGTFDTLEDGLAEYPGAEIHTLAEYYAAPSEVE